MVLNSAVEDLRATTLRAISGSLRKLQYLAGLRTSEGNYLHWGLARVHGDMAAAKALEQEHRSLLSKILATPIQTLVEEVKSSSEVAGLPPATYLEQLTGDRDLLPPEPGAGSERHLNSVLRALSHLVKNPRGAIRPTS